MAGTKAPVTSEFSLEARVAGGPHAASRARRLIQDELEPRLPPAMLADVVLLVTELVANGVWHGGAGEEATLRVRVEGEAGAVRVEVDNPDPDAGGVPAQRDPDLTGGGGLGLHIVERVAARWGVRSAPRTTVWFELDR